MSDHGTLTFSTSDVCTLGKGSPGSISQGWGQAPMRGVRVGIGHFPLKLDSEAVFRELYVGYKNREQRLQIIEGLQYARSVLGDSVISI